MIPDIEGWITDLEKEAQWVSEVHSKQSYNAEIWTSAPRRASFELRRTALLLLKMGLDLGYIQPKDWHILYRRKYRHLIQSVL
jgi:hypothetical protein